MFDGDKLIIIIIKFIYFYVYLPIVQTTENSKYNFYSRGLRMSEVRM